MPWVFKDQTRICELTQGKKVALRLYGVYSESIFLPTRVQEKPRSSDASRSAAAEPLGTAGGGDSQAHRPLLVTPGPWSA